MDPASNGGNLDQEAPFGFEAVEYDTGSEGDTLIIHDLHQLSPVTEVSEPSPHRGSVRGANAPRGAQGLSTLQSENAPLNSLSGHAGPSSSHTPPILLRHVANFPSSATVGSTPNTPEVIATIPFAYIPSPPPARPREVWTTNAPAFAGGLHPGIRFVADAHSSEPNLSRHGRESEGINVVARRYHTDPEGAAGKNKQMECGCRQCDEQKSRALSKEMVYAYLAMRGASTDERGVFGSLVAHYRGSGRPDEFPTCPHAISKLSDKLEKAATSYVPSNYQEPYTALELPILDVPRFVRDHVGASGVVPFVATNFNKTDVSDDGDPTEGVISPCAFLGMASGCAGGPDVEKPLPPLPSDARQTPREQVEQEWKDRVDDTGFRHQICEETGDALTGSYTLSSNPSMLNEPPGVRHLDRLRGAFGSLFIKMQPRLGRHLDRIRLGLGNQSTGSLSIFDEDSYTNAELQQALNSASASPINGVLPGEVLASLRDAEKSARQVESLEARLHGEASQTSARLSHLRGTFSRVSGAVNYILEHRSSTRRAKIRRSVRHRLRELEHRHARALDSLREEEARRERDMEYIRTVERALEWELKRVEMGGVVEVMEEAERIWDEVHGTAGESPVLGNVASVKEGR
ncbi:uncharacterized protein DNG_06139 [Cephalotrichum gorgonifer]|uniref:Uncharacterized protein n=1 Tax=Cephalotrichum gorgonifer TaxID=2041049 RepID=A0AAE8MZ31_9PEZI|nr:uncharacterized protein DNG_06139 [Cephalotrichum gorgonifer]